MAAPSLDHLRTFVVAHRAGSLTEAGRLLGLSQPTVSAHVRALERSLGLRLFERTPTGVVATARADALARVAGPSIDALDDLVTPGGSAVSAAVHLGGPAELLSVAVVPRLAELQAAAGVPLRLRFGLAEDLLEQLRTGALDLVVSAIQPHVAGVTAVPLLDEEFVLIAAPAWAATAADDVAASTSVVPLVAYAENLPIVRRYWRSVFGRRPDVRLPASVVPDLRGIADAVAGGAGMSVLPRYLVEERIARGELVVLHEPEVAPLNTVYLAAREGERRASLRAVAAAVREMMPR